MKHSMILLTAVLVCGCCPCRNMAVTGQRDSIRVHTDVRTEYRPDTVIVKVPAETVRQCVRDTTSRLETSLAVSDARITRDGKLFHSLENKVQEHPVAVKVRTIYRDSVVWRDRVEIRRVETNILRWWQKVLCWAGGIAVAAISLTVAFKAGRRIV